MILRMVSGRVALRAQSGGDVGGAGEAVGADGEVAHAGPPKSRIWYLPPRCRIPDKSFGACFLRA